MKRTIAITATVLGLGLSLIGCGSRPDPCSTLQPPTQQEITALQAGAEIEREVETNGHEYECELTQGVGGGFSWQQEQDTD